jgi:site-specific DNA-methyltransferase (adenine-specific)
MTTNFYSSPQAFSSETDDWATPASFYAEIAKEFHFVLDAAASSTNCVVPSWYGLDHPDQSRRDGLTQDWAAEAAALGGAVWMNPPYGKTIIDWVRKADAECTKGATVVCLVPSRTDTRWFHNYCAHHELRFVKGRLKFGSATNSAPFPSLVVVMRGAQ